ncbi:efflux RND transporter permease subunit [Alterisphingorhabdus coralli]|uniref:Efflux RND transporter permease subunit n=1 Tax=Alterisphingorhabdus coralli TaxID=3071408 RepID=A0AA97F966_9SPHN|nr:efflux RND transporter permease subunit [Parasphingorhabdus sp. SCSIO 66989]WOE75342.1 efflux RND transporter permease subunit [Parasphingorhabdus sp. SCSIO 66989]
MDLAEFSIKNRLICFIVIAIAMLSGWYSYQNIARFEDPEFTIRTAQIITEYPGATPEEVANEVTEALESAVQQLQEVEEIRSISSAGRSEISVDILYRFSPEKDDLQLIWTKLRNKVADAQSRLPPGVKTSQVNDDFGDVYGLYYLVTGDGFSYAELYDYVRDLRTDLLSVDDVAKVQPIGAQQEVIYVEISRERANALGLSVQQIYADLAEQNSVVSAGDIRLGDFRLEIQPTGNINSVEAISNLVVSTAATGRIVTLRDVATVTRDYVDPPSLIIRHNGKPAIGIGVSNISGANVAKMGNAIDAKLEETKALRPIGIEVHEFYHQGKIVEVAVSDFVVNVIAALIIVLVTLFFFMGLRSAVIIGAVLILTIAATLGTMFVMNIPMHRISLGALIIALGMLVDNAIVVTEGILVGTQQGQKKLDIAKEIVRKTKWPLLGGTLVGIIAFAPVGFAPGSTAEYTGDLFWVVMISLLYSWLFAITAVPLFADMLFPEPQEGEIEEKPEHPFFARYKAFLRAMLARSRLTVIVVVGLFVAAILGFNYIKPGFFPPSTTPQLVVDLNLPEGTDIAVTNAEMTKLENYLRKLDGVDTVQTLVGMGTLRYMLVYSPESPNSAYGQFLIKVEEYDLIPDMLNEIQQHIDANYPNAQAKVWQFQLGPGGGSKIEAEFSGPDPDVLRGLADKAKAIMVADGGAVSVKDDWSQQVTVVRPVYNEDNGRRLGISREDLADALRANFSGRAVGVYREEDLLIQIVARAPERERVNAEALRGIQIVSPVTGASVPILEVVDRFETIRDNAKLRRVDRVWAINAQSDPAPGDLAGVLRERIAAEVEAIDLPEGYSFKWNGEYGDSSEANENLATTFPLGFSAMVLVVVFLFNALRQPLVIWLVVPLCLVGVVLGLLVTNTAFEFMAILGLLSLSGLLIKNAIVLVDQMDLEISEGKPRYDAVIDSATSRVRPVMMGSMTTVLGVIPLLLDAFFKSMAVVLIFGLTFATLLTLVMIPIFYAMIFGISPDETADKKGAPA